ncbi:uncharacterized protein LOC133904022 [Phragmites australis]|uniref:uncharacterized protein LOC133904022 n=1 Tax=Phragmites australis TaxID=29695 RepID=UPI002D79E36F|nr:uncharacterized protein LOC133904022 [Phragmites australis]
MASAGGDQALKLLGVWDSPYVNRVQIVLNLKGLSYEYVEEDLHNKSELLVASNPVHKKVPVLIHGGKPVAESQVIVQYLDEVFVASGPSVLPADPYERANARFWAAFVDDKVGSPWYTVLFAREADKKADAAARIVAALETLEGAFRECSGGTAQFFGGGGIGLVDVVLGSYLGWFKVIEKMVAVRVLDTTRTPLLATWGERFRAADPVKGVLPDDVDKVLEFLQTFLDLQIQKQELPMAGGGNLKVLGVWTSPFVIRVRVVLNLKGLPYEYVEENLGNKSALLLGSNPVHKSVPVLLHDDRPVNESQIIVQYIEEVWAGVGPAVLPSDPYERAVARFWAAYIDDKVGSAWLGMLFKCRNEEDRAEAVARAEAALETLEGAFKECSKGKPFFGGDGIGFVDVVLGGYLGWFGVINRLIERRLIDPARTPLLAAWEERFRAADAAKGIVPDDVDKMLEFLQTLRSLSNYKPE